MPWRSVLRERRVIKKPANPLGQQLRRKRFLEVVAQLIVCADANVVGIARHKKNSEVRLEDTQMLGQFCPAHARHHHVGEQKLNMADLPCGDQASLQSVL